MWTGLNAAIGSWGMSAISAPRIARIAGPAGGEPGDVDDLLGRRAGRGSGPTTIRPGELHELEDGPHRDRLAAAALAHDPEHLAGEDVEAQPVDRPDHALLEEERHPQVPDGQERGQALDFRYISACARSPNCLEVKV